MKRRRILSLWVAAAALTTASAIPVGAYFQADQASATGSAPAGTMQTVVLEALIGLTGETAATALQPGSTGEVVLKVNNPNAFTVKLVSVTSIGAPTLVGSAGCTPANAGVEFLDRTGLAMPISPGIQLLRLPGAASMSIASEDTCQGASFALPVTIRVETPS